MKSICKLCSLVLSDEVTIYYEDDIAYYCECSMCGIPMIVLKEHGKLKIDDPTHGQIVKTARIIFPGCTIKQGKNHDEDHWHNHILIRQ